jgi:hypothetical protein
MLRNVNLLTGAVFDTNMMNIHIKFLCKCNNHDGNFPSLVLLSVFAASIMVIATL